jgi:hypothetical protein
MVYVTAARYESDYRVRVEFSDGASGVVDLQDDLWGQVFEPLKDKEQFRRFTVSEVFHTIVWENGADMAPEHLHDKLTGKSPQRTDRRGVQAGRRGRSTGCTRRS